LDLPRYVDPEYLALWFQEPFTHQANEERVRSQGTPIERIHGRRMDSQKDFIVPSGRLLYLFTPENVG